MYTDPEKSLHRRNRGNYYIYPWNSFDLHNMCTGSIAFREEAGGKVIIYIYIFSGLNHQV